MLCLKYSEGALIERFESRSFSEKDASTLSLLAEEFLPRETTDEKRMSTLRQALKNPDYKLLLAELNGEIVGFIDQWIIDDFTRGGKVSFIQNLYVASEHRAKGIGSRLLQEILKDAKGKKFERFMWSLVLKTSPPLTSIKSMASQRSPYSLRWNMDKMKFGVNMHKLAKRRIVSAKTAL